MFSIYSSLDPSSPFFGRKILFWIDFILFWISSLWFFNVSASSCNLPFYLRFGSTYLCTLFSFLGIFADIFADDSLSNYLSIAFLLFENISAYFYLINPSLWAAFTWHVLITLAILNGLRSSSFTSYPSLYPGMLNHSELLHPFKMHSRLVYFLVPSYLNMNTSAPNRAFILSIILFFISGKDLNSFEILS